MVTVLHTTKINVLYVVTYSFLHLDLMLTAICTTGAFLLVRTCRESLCSLLASICLGRPIPSQWFFLCVCVCAFSVFFWTTDDKYPPRLNTTPCIIRVFFFLGGGNAHKFSSSYENLSVSKSLFTFVYIFFLGHGYNSEHIKWRSLRWLTRFCAFGTDMRICYAAVAAILLKYR